jgi:hypothetical protein
MDMGISPDSRRLAAVSHLRVQEWDFVIGNPVLVFRGAPPEGPRLQSAHHLDYRWKTSRLEQLRWLCQHLGFSRSSFARCETRTGSGRWGADAELPSPTSSLIRAAILHPLYSSSLFDHICTSIESSPGTVAKSSYLPDLVRVSRARIRSR